MRLSGRSAYRQEKYIPLMEFSWAEWLGNKSKEVTKEDHVNLPSKIFQNYGTKIILKIKLLVILSAT